MLEFGRPYGFGLEAGSKPELLVVAALADNDTPIICNGFKDAEFIEMAMLAQKIGRHIIPVVEKYTELALILEYAEKIGVRPTIGMRVKLAARGGGRWQSSGGYRSKFGLTVGEMLRGLEELKARGMADCFQLLHFHLGSQIPNIRVVKGALNEAARVYVELVKAGAGLRYMDVGGGLGVDYDGSQTNFESSVNYTLEEYANDVVYHLQTVCDEAKVPHPTIISESGRAIVAYHSVLVFNVLDVSELGDEYVPKAATPDMEQPLIDLIETYDGLTARNALESYHDAQQALDMAMNLFSGGYLPLDQRSLAENLYWAICMKVRKLARDAGGAARRSPEPRRVAVGHLLLQLLAVSIRCPTAGPSSSCFRSCRFTASNERPDRVGVLGDITCDSDGKVDQFIDRRERQADAAAASFAGAPYYLGRLSGRRLSGDPRRPAQSARRYPRGARQPRRDRRRRARCRDQGRHGPRGPELRRVQRRSAGGEAAHRRRDRGAGRPARLRRVRPSAPVLRGRPQRLYLPGRAAAAPVIQHTTKLTKENGTKFTKTNICFFRVFRAG